MVVEVENLWKTFQIPHEKRTTLFENLTGLLRPDRYTTLTVLRDISFKVEEGEFHVTCAGDDQCACRYICEFDKSWSAAVKTATGHHHHYPGHRHHHNKPLKTQWKYSYRIQDERGTECTCTISHSNRLYI